ncbi:MAG: hypothetical protein ABI843_16860 [Dokdonella sp.]
MSRARLLLHLAALLAPFVAACLWCLLLFRSDAALAYRQIAIFGGLGVVAAQFVALLRWRALEQRARNRSGAWKTGIGMAAITHVLFGLLFVAAYAASARWLQAGEPANAKDLLVQAAFFTAMSLLAVGVITLPLTAWLAHAIAKLRGKEFTDDAR